MSSYTHVPGTQDRLDLRLYSYTVNLLRRHLERHNFHEIELPILEFTNLFIRSVGTETDIVSKEMYTFETSGGESICLRPEATASTMRAFLEHKIETIPWRVFTCGPMFRHERPQKGRWRQFTQCNIEVIGSANVAQDAHFIRMLDRFFRDQCKLETFVLRINWLGTLDDRARHRDALQGFIATINDQICATCQVRVKKNLLRIFDCKNTTCKDLYTKAPRLTDNLAAESAADWQRLRNLLSALSVNFVHDPYLVRGLDYYYNSVFEFSSTELGAQDTFCAGGRWELGAALDAERAYPSIGASVGIGRLLMLLESRQHLLALPEPAPLHVIIPLSEEQQQLGLFLADEFTRAGLATEILVDQAPLKQMMRKADKLGARYTLVIGEDEQKAGMVTIKYMPTGEIIATPLTHAVTHCTGR